METKQKIKNKKWRRVSEAVHMEEVEVFRMDT